MRNPLRAVFAAFDRTRKRRAANSAALRFAQDTLARAEAARDAGRILDAALLFETAARLVPNSAAIHLQCAQMLDQAGDFRNAEPHYLEAAGASPNDADSAHRLERFYRRVGRLTEAERASRGAADRELGGAEPAVAPGEPGREGAGKAPSDSDAVATVRSTDIDRLMPELAPGLSPVPPPAAGEAIHVARLGRHERARDGMLRTLRGIEAVRGYCISSNRLVEMQILVGSRVVYRGSLQEGYPVRGGSETAALQKYVFNVWHDFSDVRPGRHELELRFVDCEQRARSFRESVMTAAPLPQADHPDSDALVGTFEPHGLTVDDQINSYPSVVRSAKRAFFKEQPRTILVQRADQLGDLVCSVPAIIKLREIFHEARLVGLVTADNEAFARSLNLFHDVVVAEFSEDPTEQRRTMTLEHQERLRRELQTYQFDLAVDLSPGSESRPLLFLSDAAHLCGFGPRDFPWLSCGFDGAARDPVNGLPSAPHASTVLGLTEWLRVLHDSQPVIITRPDLRWDSLLAHGIGRDERFAVLHTGARLAFSRWRGYGDLASLILDSTDLNVVLLGDGSAEWEHYDGGLLSSERVHLIDRRLPFDDLDALLSFCTVFVGNDSGPKHLAALRGAEVISIHMARLNWNEWGQVSKGLIISRRVPCAGCAIERDPEECGKDFACLTHIKPDEVFGALRQVLEKGAGLHR